MAKENGCLIPETSIEWNELWRLKQSTHKLDHDAKFWNERAKSFTNKDTPGSYTDRFLELADIHAGESVMDMGCGTGNLSIPLASAGHQVLAADFSSVMLEKLKERASAGGLNNIKALELSWEDDWVAAGIKPKSFDVCLASRSIATSDIRSALLKLCETARRYVCITLSCDSSPRIDDRALREIGIQIHSSYDDVYALAILQGEGYFPKIDYIKTKRIDTFDSFDAALEKYTAMIDAVIEQIKSEESKISREEAISKMKDWLGANLIEAHYDEDDGNNSRHLRLKVPRDTTWAFMSWEV